MHRSHSLILAIETSCDETAAAVLAFAQARNNQQQTTNLQLLASAVSSQVKLHAKYGGVVPMLAAREQQKNIEPVITETLRDARVSLADIDYFAVTRGPGLIPSLHVGVNYARAIAFAMQKPLIGINHLEGHVYSNWLTPIAVSPKSQTPNSKQQRNSIKSLKSYKLKVPIQNGSRILDKVGTISYKLQKIRFPILNLIVSGGHTELVLMRNHGQYEMIGETRDDAAGEAFDKVARMLHLAYPGGPALAKEAERGNSTVFAFPRPMLAAKSYDFSFSGLKTAVLYTLQKLKPISQKLKADLCASFQQAAVDVLTEKTIRAAKTLNVKGVFVSGGVSANKKLRETFAERMARELPNAHYRHPLLEFTGDNAAMIAMAAYWKINQKQKTHAPEQVRYGAGKNQKFGEVVADANLRIA